MATDHKAIIIQLNQAFEDNDLILLGDMLTDDIQWRMSGGAKPVIGKAAFLAVCESMPVTCKMKITVNDVLVDGNKAVAEGLLEMEDEAGKPTRQDFCDIYQFNGDKIKSIRTYLDKACEA